MKANDIMREVITPKWLEEHGERTGDRIKIGNPEQEVTKIATTLTATPDVIRAVGEWGAELIITHEPTFYNRDAINENSRLFVLKRDLIKKYGITIYRYHDSMHWANGDRVNSDFIQRMGWKGKFDNVVDFISDEPLDVREVVENIKKNLDLKHPRIVGKTDGKVRNIRINLGLRSSESFVDFAEDPKWELVICGELCECMEGEIIRDAAQMGDQKTLIILGHAGSEKYSMKTLAHEIDGKFDGAEARYFDCGELYTYLDS